MFVWPEQIAMKFVAAHSDSTDDFVDRLNYVYTVGLLIFMATFTGAKQHFGTAIQCMVPTHFPGSWVNYVQDYCFVSNTYMVNASRIIVKGEATNVYKEEIVYYQWVPYILLLQALLCYLPKFLWNIIIITRDLDMRSIVEEAMKLPSITTLSVRRKHLRRVANFAVGYIKYKQKRRTAQCCSAYHFYVFVKWFYFGSCLCQILLINNFVGDGCLLWGYRFMEEILKGNDWKASNIFPRVTFCDVKIAVRFLSFCILLIKLHLKWFLMRDTEFFWRRNDEIWVDTSKDQLERGFQQIGQVNTHTMQCVLMINVLNEKLYVALWFWLSVLMLINAISAINSMLLLLCPYLHYTRVLSLLQTNGSYIDAKVKRSLLNFAENVLCLDGILLLSFVKNRANGLIASDLTREIWFIADRCNRDSCVQDGTCDDEDFVGGAPSCTKLMPGGINAFGPVMRKNA